MYCKDCGKLLLEDSKHCPHCGTANASVKKDSQPIDVQDIARKGMANAGLILVILEVIGFIISLFSSAFGGGIVIIALIVAIVRSMEGYKKCRKAKGFKAYLDYIWTGAMGKNPEADRMDCLAVALGVGIYVLTLIAYAILSGQQTEEVYYYETWTFWN